MRHVLLSRCVLRNQCVSCTLPPSHVTSWQYKERVNQHKCHQSCKGYINNLQMQSCANIHYMGSKKGQALLHLWKKGSLCLLAHYTKNLSHLLWRCQEKSISRGSLLTNLSQRLQTKKSSILYRLAVSRYQMYLSHLISIKVISCKDCNYCCSEHNVKQGIFAIPCLKSKLVSYYKDQKPCICSICTWIWIWLSSLHLNLFFIWKWLVPGKNP